MRHQRYLLPTLLLLSPCLSLASPTFETGFYMGAKIGAQQAMASWDQANYANAYGDFTFTNPTDSGEINMVINNPDEDGQAFHTNLMGNFAIGYARVVKKYFVGLEASINLAEDQELSWETNESNSSQTLVEGGFLVIDGAIALDTETDVTLENPDINLDIRPGYLLAKNFLVYGRVGVAFNELSMEQDVTTNASATVDRSISMMCVAGGTSSEEETVYGLRLGLGMEYKVTQQLGFSVDYIFTDYGDIDVEYHDQYPGPVTSSTADTIDLAMLTDVSSEAEVTKSTLTFGVNWYFGGKKHHPHRGMIDK